MPARNGDWKRLGIGGGDAVPAQRVQISRKSLRRVESARGDGIPGLSGHDPRIQLPLPKDLEGLTLGVIVNTRQPDECGIAWIYRSYGLLNQVQALPDCDDLAGFGESPFGRSCGLREFTFRIAHNIAFAVPQVPIVN